MEIVLIAIVVGGVCSFFSYKIAGTSLAAIIGFLLGPMGVLIACFIKKKD